MTVRQRQRQGFTLIEMLIVGSLIVLFAGLAMIGAQQMYDSNRRKAMFDETKSIGSALSFARQDVGFYPRIHVLGLPKSMVYFSPTTGRPYCLPAMDTYGLYGTGDNQNGVAMFNPPLYTMDKNWRGPYMTVSQARALNSSGRRSGLIKMRLMDTAFANLGGKNNTLLGDDPTLVDWPTDTWGNPYVFYQVSVDSTKAAAGSNPKGLRLVKNPTEDGDYFVAVVSYGANHVPGGNELNPESGFSESEMLYVKGDLGGQGADFTLKSVTAQGQARLAVDDDAWMARFAQSISSTINGKIGITDNGSDDVFFKL